MKQSLIILHGALGSKAQFDHWKILLAEKYECRTFDFPGHGNRSHEQTIYTIEKFSQSLQEYIHEQNMDNPHVLGYSMGGYVALYLALQNEKSLGKIMTLATKFDWNPETAKREAAYLEPGVIEAKVPQLAAQLKQRHGVYWKSVATRTAEMMMELGKNPVLTIERMKNISNPLRFCVGDKDKMVGIQETVTMYKNAQNASLSVLPDTGHLPEKMEPRRIRYELVEFLSGQ